MSLENNDIKYTQVFMITLFIIGIILTIVSWNIDSNLENKVCKSKTLKTLNKIVLCIGIIFIVSSIWFYLCSRKCKNSIHGLHYILYIYAMLILGFVLIILGAIITSESNKYIECNNKKDPPVIWILGTVITITSLVSIYNTYKNDIM